MGHRKSWLILSQLLLIALLITLGFIDPKYNLLLMAIIIVCIGFSSATQDAMVDTYRIESAPPELQSAMSGIYIVGYRLGMIVAGAGSLFLASFFLMNAKWTKSLLPISASEHGHEIDLLMNISLGLIIIVFLILQPVLFYFSYKYRGVKNRNINIAVTNMLEVTYHPKRVENQ